MPKTRMNMHFDPYRNVYTDCWAVAGTAERYGNHPVHPSTNSEERGPLQSKNWRTGSFDVSDDTKIVIAGSTEKYDELALADPWACTVCKTPLFPETQTGQASDTSIWSDRCLLENVRKVIPEDNEAQSFFLSAYESEQYNWNHTVCGNQSCKNKQQEFLAELEENLHLSDSQKTRIKALSGSHLPCPAKWVHDMSLESRYYQFKSLLSGLGHSFHSVISSKTAGSTCQTKDV